MSTETFVPGIRSSGFYTTLRDTCTSDRVSRGVDGGPELHGRMYPASGLDSSAWLSWLEDERKSTKDICRDRDGRKK